MKKILGVSIAALLAVTPMLAGAADNDSVTPGYVDPTHTTSTSVSAGTEPRYETVGIIEADKGHIASTAYVKGAYNSAIRSVNATYDKLNTDKQNKIMNDATGAAQAQITGATITVAASNASDTLVPTEKAVREAINTAASSAVSGGAGIAKDANGVLDVDLTTNGGLQLSGEGAAATLGVKVNATTLEVGADGIGIKNQGVGTSQLANNAVATGKIADDAVTTAKILDANVTTDKLAAKAVTTAKIDDGAVTTDQLGASAVTNGKIADGAVSASKLESGLVQISVRSSVDSNAEGYAAWNGNNTVASEKAVATAITNRLMNGSDNNAVAMESVVQQTVRDAATLDQNTGNTLASEKAVRSAIDTATTGMATQAGVVATINTAIPTLSIYDDWSNQSHTASVTGTIAVGSYTQGS